MCTYRGMNFMSPAKAPVATLASITWSWRETIVYRVPLQWPLGKGKGRKKGYKYEM